MFRSLVRVWPSLLALLLLAVPAGAEVYYVTLTNGSVIETATQPQEASWDASMVLLMTDVGNWIGLPKAEVEGVRSELDNEGYGLRINADTILLGWAPNDNPIPGEEGKAGDEADGRVADALERAVAIREEESRYSVDQFVEPDESQGIPSRFGGNGVQLPVSPVDPPQ
jgi:hypothetical protein